MGDHGSLLDGCFWYISFLISITWHEAAHAWAAWKMGDPTAFEGGQVSLDPMPHIKREPIGTVVVPLLSYMAGGWMIGWASAPYNPQWAAANPRKAAWMALAGPSANLLLLLVVLVLMKIGLWLGFFSVPYHFTAEHVVWSHSEGVLDFAATFLSILFFLNLLLLIFNLIPLPPLDGASLPLLFLGEQGAGVYQRVLRAPGLRLVGIFIAWKLFSLVFPDVIHFTAHLIYPDSF